LNKKAYKNPFTLILFFNKEGGMSRDEMTD